VKFIEEENMPEQKKTAKGLVFLPAINTIKEIIFMLKEKKREPSS
jgi:hypothetical protein